MILVIAYLLFSGGGGANYHLVFANAGQLVKGDQVQVGGVPVGSVTNIELSKNYEAIVTIHIEGSLHAAAPGDRRTGQGAVAGDRGRSLHPALTRPEQRARAEARHDPAGVGDAGSASTSISCSTR